MNNVYYFYDINNEIFLRILYKIGKNKYIFTCVKVIIETMR